MRFGYKYLIFPLKIEVRRRKGRQAAMGKFEWQIIPLANPDGYEYTR
jgi:murein tripeptide amidase MpaA